MTRLQYLHVFFTKTLKIYCSLSLTFFITLKCVISFFFSFVRRRKIFLSISTVGMITHPKRNLFRFHIPVDAKNCIDCNVFIFIRIPYTVEGEKGYLSKFLIFLKAL